MLELTFCTSYIKNHKESAMKCYEKKSNKKKVNFLGYFEAI